MKNHPITPSDWVFEFQQRNHHPILMADLWSRALWLRFSSEANLPVDGLDHLFTSENKGYFKPVQKQVMLAALVHAVDTDPDYSKEVSQKTQKRIAEFEEFVNEALAALAKKDDASLVSLWKTFIDKMSSLIPWFYVPYYLSSEDLLTNRVKQGLEQHRPSIESITDFQQALFILVSPQKPLELQREQQAFFDLVANAAGKSETCFEAPAFFEKAQKYLDEFGWTKTFLLLPIEPLTLQELKERIRSALVDRSLETYQLQLGEKDVQAKKRQALLDVLKDDQALLDHISVAQELAWLLTASVEQSLGACAKLIPFYKRIADAVGVTYVDWVHLTIDEITEALSNPRADIAARIPERRTSYVFAMEQGQPSLVSGDEAKKMIEALDAAADDVDTAITELRGQSASRGTVVGRVRIARLASEAHAVEVDEILVCAMTSPDYLPAMKRAAAIVTDEGGLLCHAAIVSRELGKPCVIATKIATRLLKTGDMVEVNADKGVVILL